MHVDGGLLRGEERLPMVIILDNTLAVVFLGLCGRGAHLGPRRGKEVLLVTSPLHYVSGRCKSENEVILWNGDFQCRAQTTRCMLSCGVSGMPLLHCTKRPVLSYFTENKSIQNLVCSAPLESLLL